MSIPEERLKKRAEELLKHPSETLDERAVREQLAYRQTRQRLHNAGRAWLRRAETLIEATNARIYHDIRYAEPGQCESFTLEVSFTLGVGRYSVMQATMKGDGWDVIVHDHHELITRAYASDDAFCGAMDELLEPLVASALEAIAGGTEIPAVDWFAAC